MASSDWRDMLTREQHESLLAQAAGLAANNLEFMSARLRKLGRSIDAHTASDLAGLVRKMGGVGRAPTTRGKP